MTDEGLVERQHLFTKGLFVKGSQGMTHNMVCVQGLSDYCCSLQAIMVWDCTVGRLASGEDARSAFDKFPFAFFFFFHVSHTLKKRKSGTRLLL